MTRALRERVEIGSQQVRRCARHQAKLVIAPGRESCDKMKKPRCMMDNREGGPSGSGTGTL